MKPGRTPMKSGRAKNALARALKEVQKSMTLAQRCFIHAGKMQDEGWYVTANVLAAAAEALEAATVLRATLPSHWHDYAVTNFDDAMAQAVPSRAAATRFSENNPRRK